MCAAFLFPMILDEYAADILWALATLPAKSEQYRKAQEYYDGIHPLNFATRRYREAFGRLFAALSLNVCATVIDTKVARLKLEGFSFVSQNEDDAQPTEEAQAGLQQQARKIGRRTREVWRHNRMDKRLKRVLSEALLKGDSYVIAWPDAQGRAVFHPNAAGLVVVKEDTENPGFIVFAAKAWRDGKRIRLTLYYPDKLVKLVTAAECVSMPRTVAAFKQYQEEREPWPLPNPWGKVPVFHLGDGDSHLKNLFKIQDALNKAVCDKMIAMEFQAFRQRWATGLELPTDPITGIAYNPFKPGAENLWVIPDGEHAKFGDFAEANLEQFIKVKESFIADFALVSGIPIYAFKLSGDIPSGESLKVLDKRLADQVEDIQTSEGDTLCDLMRFALQIEGEENVDLEAQWKDTSPRNELEFAQTQTAKKAWGVSNRQLQIEAGYKEDEIARMDGERQDETQAAGALMGGLFNSGQV